MILFIDMDHFFAACEETRHPELKAKPLVIGTGTIAKKEKGVVQTCNYVARKFGIRSGMPTVQALKLNPKLVYLESDEQFYTQMSELVMKEVRSYGYRVEAISIDEAAVDIGNKDREESLAAGKMMKENIRKRLGLPCTIGISTGRTYAKMVCDSSKPDGLGFAGREDISEFLKDKDVSKILGVGAKTAEKLNGLGICKISDLAKADPNVLAENFGAFGRELYLIANGRDEGGIVEEYAVLSVGRERTFDRDTKDQAKIDRMLAELAKEVIDEIKGKNLWYKGISVKARYSDFTTRTKDRRLNNYSDSYDTIYSTAAKLMRELADGKSIRKIGVRAFDVSEKKGQRRIF